MFLPRGADAPVAGTRGRSVLTPGSSRPSGLPGSPRWLAGEGRSPVTVAPTVPDSHRLPGAPLAFGSPCIVADPGHLTNRPPPRGDQHHWRAACSPHRCASSGLGERRFFPPRARRSAMAARTHVESGVAPNGRAAPGSVDARAAGSARRTRTRSNRPLGRNRLRRCPGRCGADRRGPRLTRPRSAGDRATGAGQHVAAITPLGAPRCRSSTLHLDAGIVAALNTAVNPASSADHARRRGSRRMLTCGMPSSRYSTPSSTKPKER